MRMWVILWQIKIVITVYVLIAISAKIIDVTVVRMEVNVQANVLRGGDIMCILPATSNTYIETTGDKV